MKKKIVALCLVVCLLAIAIVGGTLAYFTDTHAQTNTFTAGNVDITLDEAVIKKVDNPTEANYGDLVAVGSGERTSENQDYGKLYPGQNIWKDPTIKNVGSEDAYIAAKVTITGDIHDLIGVPGYDNIDITLLASGGLIDETSAQVTGWNGLSMVYETATCVIYQDASKAAADTWTLYIFIKEAMSTNESVVLFNTLSINDAWDNAQMAHLQALSIEVEAFATQEYGFSDCFTAITTAFDTEFAF